MSFNMLRHSWRKWRFVTYAKIIQLFETRVRKINKNQEFENLGFFMSHTEITEITERWNLTKTSKTLLLRLKAAPLMLWLYVFPRMQASG
jgi:hypothetical protein